MLEAGSALGMLVYPPLEENEAFEVEFQGDGRYVFTFYMRARDGQWQPIFRTVLSLPVGGVGKVKEEMTLLVPGMPLSAEAASSMMRIFIVPEDLGTPTGAVTLRGSVNFRTPEGWDTVYTSVINHIERPIAPTLVVRVETDWYPHETEFRYVLQPGEGIPGARNVPIGQVFFVPREAVTARDCTAEELEAVRAARREFSAGKDAATVMTPYGLQYSPYYARQSRAKK